MKVLITSLSLVMLMAIAVSPSQATRRENPLQVANLVAPHGSRKSLLGSGENFLVTVQSAVLQSKANVIQNSIDYEAALLAKLTEQKVFASGPECVDYIRRSADSLMNLAGVKYSHCLSEADDRLFEALSKVDGFSFTREQYDTFNLLAAFRGRNVFLNSAEIQAEFAAKLRANANIPSDLYQTIQELTFAQQDELEQCMHVGEARLAENFQLVEDQLQAVCAKAT